MAALLNSLFTLTQMELVVVCYVSLASLVYLPHFDYSRCTNSDFVVEA